MIEAFDWSQAVFIASLMQGPHPSLSKRPLHPRLFAHTERDASCRVDIGPQLSNVACSSLFENKPARNGS